MRGPMLERRHLLAGIGATALFGGAFVPRVASAGNGDPRFLTVILRGALDGLSAVPPIGDPSYAAARGRLAMATSGEHAVLPGDGFFAFNPKLPRLAEMFRRGEALVIQAVATPYRDRSHFDGQEVLETGLERPGGRDGWLNRAIAAMPQGPRVASGPRGLALMPTVPLVIRGTAPVMSWAPQFTYSADVDTVRRILAVYESRDHALATALRAGAQLDTEANAQPMRGGATGGAGAAQRFAELARFAAERLARPDGPRVAVLNVDGWDTHAMQGPVTGRLGQLLDLLDQGIEALRTGLGPAWRESSVLLATEFGRTVRINGTDGTDHGTATIALLVGGAVKGGRVVADWPGLGENRLYQSRDLMPTTDLRAVIKGVLNAQFDMPERVLNEQVFPGSANIRPLRDLVRA